MRLSVLFSLVVVSLYSAQHNDIRRDGHNWSLTEQGALSVDARGQVRIKTSGNIRLRGIQGDQFTYKLTRTVRTATEEDARALLRGFPLTTARQGPTALLEVAYGPIATTLEVTVPRTLESVAIQILGGDIDVSDLNGSLSAEASGGRINIGRVGGNVDIRAAGGAIVLDAIGRNARCLSGGGAISAGEIGGDAQFETGGGDILIRKAGGKVRATTAGGGIQILEAKGMVQANTFGGSIRVGPAKGVHCESASGSIEAQFLPGVAMLDSFLSTGSGDITVWIPSNLQLSIRAQNEGSGNIRTLVSDFPGLRVVPSGAAVLGELSLNGGGPLLQLAGSGGRIYIHKR
jgi:DUF4097 and DUF4098 domain-containing protein YvlB